MAYFVANETRRKFQLSFPRFWAIIKSMVWAAAVVAHIVLDRLCLLLLLTVFQCVAIQISTYNARKGTYISCRQGIAHFSVYFSPSVFRLSQIFSWLVFLQFFSSCPIFASSIPSQRHARILLAFPEPSSLMTAANKLEKNTSKCSGKVSLLPGMCQHVFSCFLDRLGSPASPTAFFSFLPAILSSRKTLFQVSFLVLFLCFS